MNRDRDQASWAWGQRGAGTKPTSLLLLFFLFLLAGCLGEDNTPLPGLPPSVTNISNTDTVSFAPSTASNGNVVYVAWTHEGIAGDFDIFLARSGNDGANFSPPINVSNTPEFSGNPQITISGNNVYIIWEEFVPSPRGETDIFFRRADDVNGVLTWTPLLNESGTNLSDFPQNCGPDASSDPCPSQGAAIAVDGSNVFVAWGESTRYITPPVALGQTATSFTLLNSDILMVSSADGGSNFTPVPQILSLPNTGLATQSPSQNPALTIANGQLYIAWEDFPQPDTKILFRTFDINTSIFTPLLTIAGTPLSGPTQGSNRPSLAANGLNVYLLWEGFDPNAAVNPDSEIFFIRSTDGGTTFTNPTDPGSNLSNTTSSSNNGKLAVSDSDIFVIWEDNPSGLIGISFRSSTNSGANFNPTETLINTGGSLGNTTISASGGNLFAFWEDALLGNFEIFFLPR